MSISKKMLMSISLVVVFFPQNLFGSDIFGNFTYRGKVVDADTLKPIEGAVVVAVWRKCWPGIGAGESCDFSLAKEILTDANGEWSITGPEGTWTPSMFRAILGFVVRWTRPPFLMIYKPGYFLYGKYDQRGGRGFRAISYESKDKRLVGIALERPATMREELKGLDINFNNEVPFITINDPESTLRLMNFPFSYEEDVKKISLDRVNFPNCDYWVLGLKKIASIDEWRKERLTPGDVPEWGYLPLLRKVVEEDIRKPIQID